MAAAPIAVSHLDHFVITASDIDATIAFYASALGMRVVSFANGERRALHFGSQKINLHQQGKEFEPKARVATPGSQDLCFITTTPISGVLSHLASLDIPVVEGPVKRTGAQGPMLSVYVRDPDGNLVEIANYEEGAEA
ncbi:Glyoxalase/Bleomycin resistance protein/Dihydroxybiphenyl dioxygenase [Punctularia strigosozonata HHB-11173 SS5]|uniref:Glyoxalase/Bleomycin resistance protein/Dihydroxybiphenyl dioxygenase n=1 Tax=Punctularia strigosozonata (strain HHB-11173) TaxID=741275 RepID=UPI00044171E3|nr:Glyoxalase/Bleomycin resistance protein/Dihydroxybiphenyl dioxygenase [Punctularia strigosozonata HHB-11173 SS5]EIN05328.1 Glyoxalase/Bleomycin resistance protein/Dihydroxybiphenyl dioxygenase [Punctularia strigosozonata HHB-11173 SS5]